MKASLASPGRKDGTFRDPVASVSAPALSTSLSVRRLKTSASVKGGQSPAMFSSVTSTSNRKKGGGGFEQAEPTSPKVTCIGQVRGKTSRKKEKKNKKKKNGKKKKPTTSKKVILARSMSRRLAEAGCEGSFRGEEVGEGERPVCFRNQRWVHLHLGSICEAVKGALGSEISCFHPCGRSQCSTVKGKEKAGKTCSVKMGSCGASFARWLYAIHESEESEDGGEVLAIEEEEEKVVEVDLTRMRTRTRRGSRRELEIIADELEKGGTLGKSDNTSCKHEGDDDDDDDEEEKVCVPPPNALLLMRCRSDPVRMAALQNRFWGSPVASKVKDTQEDGDEDKNTKVVQQNILKKREDMKSMGEAPAETEQEVANTGIASQLQEVGNGDDARIGSAGETPVDSSTWEKNQNGEEEEKTEEEEELSQSVPAEAPQAQDLKHNPRRKKKEKKKKNRNRKTTTRRDKNGRRHSFSAEREARKSSSFSEKEAKRRFSFSSSYMEPRRSSLYLESSERRRIRPVEAEQMGSIDQQSEVKVEEQQEEQLPDCLLMMMYEPKLSMEVSKETWICSSEFFGYRHLHQHRSSQSGVNLEAKEHMCAVEKEENQEEEQEQEQEENQEEEEEKKDPSEFMDREPRLESKLKAEPPSAPPESKSGATFGPFGLTRCKSDPVRASAKISPEFCFWRARHQPAAGVGF